MIPEFYHGFMIYRNMHGPVYVSMHSGPSIETPTNRENTETPASLACLETGGTFVLSNITRKRIFGIDFNRELPTMDKALDMWNEFKTEANPKLLKNFRMRYAFTAHDRTDYKARAAVYNNFWSTLRNTGNLYVFIHRKFSRIKNYPSIMDVVSFSGKGINRRIIQNIINELNEDYKMFFHKISEDYKKAILLEQKRIFSNNERVKKRSELILRDGDFENHMASDMDVIKDFSDTEDKEALQKRFNQRNFETATKSAFKNLGNPLITLDDIFTGELAYGPKKELFLGKDKVVLEIECNEFLNHWYPEITAQIIVSVIRKIRASEEYRKIGYTQTDMERFFGRCS